MANNMPLISTGLGIIAAGTSNSMTIMYRTGNVVRIPGTVKTLSARTTNAAPRQAPPRPRWSRCHHIPTSGFKSFLCRSNFVVESLLHIHSSLLYICFATIDCIDTEVFEARRRLHQIAHLCCLLHRGMYV